MPRSRRWRSRPTTRAKTFRKATAYSITGDREKELGRRIGQQVEVIGVIEDPGKADAEKFGDLPRIKMSAWVPIKDSCPSR